MNKIVASIILLLSLAGLVSISAEAQKESIITAYQSKNSITRKKALRSASLHRSIWVQNLLATALKDKSPIVVEVAVQEIGNLRLVELSDNLISLYFNAEKKFKGYGDRVKYSIIPALGKLGTGKSKKLLIDLLAKDNGSQMGEFLLVGIKELKDKFLINNVRLYSAKMKSIISQKKAMDLDPITWSINLALIDLAFSVEAYLAQGGRNNE